MIICIDGDFNNDNDTILKNLLETYILQNNFAHTSQSTDKRFQYFCQHKFVPLLIFLSINIDEINININMNNMTNNEMMMSAYIQENVFRLAEKLKYIISMNTSLNKKFKNWYIQPISNQCFSNVNSTDNNNNNNNNNNSNNSKKSSTGEMVTNILKALTMGYLYGINWILRAITAEESGF